jgi:hypothetical protein
MLYRPELAQDVSRDKDVNRGINIIGALKITRAILEWTASKLEKFGEAVNVVLAVQSLFMNLCRRMHTAAGFGHMRAVGARPSLLRLRAAGAESSR